MKTIKNSPMQIWFWPILFGLISAAGLLVALIGDGWHDVISWMALGLVAAASIWLGLVAKRQS
ncbi:hypothetical protein SAMN05216198_0585 [Halopseudomonas litoralis]|uniref:DUF4175 domain-containing protein n=2 Tax=Halopseudomonas litoralis TaxID=797277 RepID=A0A1H1MDX0_9GAMM|nr:hypothetical protein SAMN05216198_0585 [Halopseudomonas litoralis]